jgi:fibro-slime domain-containing protein
MPIDVVFYDFRSDRSNPEFEQPHGTYNGSSRVFRPGMVEATLDLDGRPITRNMSQGNRDIMTRQTNENPYLNYGLRFWFRDWNNLTAYRMSGQPHQAGTLAQAGATYLTPFRPVYEYMHSNGNWGPQPGVGQGTDWANSNIRGGEWDAEQIRLASLNYASNGSSAFQNRVVPAQIIFNHSPTPQHPGMYDFTIPGFFPLRGGGLNSNHPGRVRFVEPDGVTSTERRGFTDNTWASTNNNTPNNYAFTMMMVVPFRMERGLVFNFTGDDDVWVFINNRLALDIGGIHEPVERNIDLDLHMDRLGLRYDNDYELRMFYCERHADGSSIRIQTNIVAARLVEMQILVDGDDMIAGEPKLATAFIVVDTGSGRLTNFEGGVFTWTARDLGGHNTPSQLTVSSAVGRPLNQSDSINVTAQLAHTVIRIYGEYCDAAPGVLGRQCVRDSADVHVRPGPPAQVFIEPSQDSTASLRSPNPIEAIRISSTDTFQDNFFAILRDRFGNWVSVAGTTGGAQWQGRTISWDTRDSIIAVPATATVPPSTFGPLRGQGRANRVATSGRTTMTVNYRIASGTHAGVNVTSEAVPVIIESITYTAARIGVMHEGAFIIISDFGETPARIGTLEMTVGADTTLYVQLRRSDGGGWDIMPVTWSSTGVPGLTPPAGSASQWSFTPTGGTNNGRITATAGTNTSAEVNVIVVNRNPTVMRFFNRRGAPNSTTEITSFLWPQQFPAEVRPYPVPAASVTVSAGNTLPITAKMFTALPAGAATWLQHLENPMGAQANMWSWSFVPGSPTNAATTLSGTSGDSIAFRSTVAHHVYQVRVVFTMGTTSIQQDIHIRVFPSMENPKLVLEPNANGLTVAPNTSQKIDTLAFAEAERSKTVYAVIRDHYDNFIGFSGGHNIYDPMYDPSVTPRPTQWTPADAAGDIVIVGNGYVPHGEGIAVKRDDSNNGRGTWLRAFDEIFNRRDSLWVNLLGYDYDEILIMRSCQNSSSGFPVGYCPVDTLRLTTNDTESIFVFGKRNDCDKPGEPNAPTGAACWESVVVDWGRSAELAGAIPTTSTGTNNWTISPQTTGSGQITATKLGATAAENLITSIPVIITVGAPWRVELVIITPADRIIAGQPISAEVRYYNRAGLITEWPASWGGQSTHFKDTLVTAFPAGAQGLLPQVSSGGVNLTPQQLFWMADGNAASLRNGTVSPRSGTGIDTVVFIIYNATDNQGRPLTHQIFMQQPSTISGIPPDVRALTALSERFVVLTGAPETLRIVEDRGERRGDTLFLRYTDPDVVLRAVTEDRYGNIIGDTPSNWVTEADEGVPTVSGDQRPLVVYRPNTATENGEARVCAVVTGSNPPVDACITIVVSGVTLRASTVITRDFNGNGYLDAIVMKFRRPVNLVSESVGRNPGSMLHISHGTTIMPVDSVTVNAADSTATIWLREATSGALQTGWRPQVTITSNSLFVEAGEQTHTSSEVLDGAAPVIDYARLFFGANSPNYIEVRFSEDIRSSNRLSFRTDALNFTPSDLFNIWELVGSSQSSAAGQQGRAVASSRASRRSAAAAATVRASAFTDADFRGPLEGYLNSITVLNFVNDNTLRFELPAGFDLSPPRHYMNIRTFEVDPLAHVLDAVPQNNAPGPNNRRVPVTYGNAPNIPPVAIPNPASPDRTRSEAPAGTITAGHDPGAIPHIRGGGGGTVFQVPIYVPRTGTVRCQIKVYDLAGNLVISGQNDNATQRLQVGPEEYAKMDLYWNGFNSKGMKVSPGTYRIVVFISYVNTNDPLAKNSKFQGTVGMSK